MRRIFPTVASPNNVLCLPKANTESQGTLKQPTEVELGEIASALKQAVHITAKTQFCFPCGGMLGAPVLRIKWKPSGFVPMEGP